MLSYYIESRNVRNFDSLIELLLCDRAKSVLPAGALSHLLRFESTLENKWANKEQLADVLDTYNANYDRFDKPIVSSIGASGNQCVNQFKNSQLQGRSQD